VSLDLQVYWSIILHIQDRLHLTVSIILCSRFICSVVILQPLLFDIHSY